MSEPQQNGRNYPWRALLVPAIATVLAALIGAVALLLADDPALSPTPSSSAFALPPGTTRTSLSPTTASGPPGSIRRRAGLTLRLGVHADLDSMEPDWNQSRAGYKGNIYFDTGREAGRQPRIQPGLRGPGAVHHRGTARAQSAGNGSHVYCQATGESGSANPDREAGDRLSAMRENRRAAVGVPHGRGPSGPRAHQICRGGLGPVVPIAQEFCRASWSNACALCANSQLHNVALLPLPGRECEHWTGTSHQPS
jgi:hypothetical protein